MTKNRAPKQAQQEFLQDAILRLGMARDQFCKRISVPRRTLDKWMLPSDAPEHRPLPEIGWSYIREILDAHGNAQ